MATSIKISQLPAKGANLEATDLLEVSEFNGTGYVTKSITGQEIIDSVSSGGVTDVTASAPLASSGGTTPDISIPQADAGSDGYLTSTDYISFTNKQDALVSGTNIKTLNGASLLGSGGLSVEPSITAGTTSQYFRGDKTFQTLDKSAVGLSNVDNTSDANKPVSTAQQTALNAKQDTLVSGTNIKTINGSSVLGSGDLTISGGGGGGIHALLKPVSGRRVSYALGNTTSGSAFTTNRLVLIPFFPANTFTISEMLINVTILGVGALCRLLIYSDNNGLPDAKLYESADLNCATSGFKIATTTFTFTAGTTYWLAFHGGANTATITNNQLAVVYPIANTGTSVASVGGYFVTATLGSAPANITGAALLNANLQWIALTQA